jgi:CheY-like chemotaxis protein
MPQSKKHILCVDDHSDICALVTLMLKEYEVISAYSMADAVKQATAQKFDLYLPDYHLPDGTGLGFLTRCIGFMKGIWETRRGR